MPRKHRQLAAPMTIGIALSFALAGIPPATAADDVISFELTTYVDARESGGSQVTPLRIIYQFDPGLAPGTGVFGAVDTFATYGPLKTMIAEVGKECVALPGMSGMDTHIGVFNNAGTTFIEDSYSVKAEGAAVAGAQMFRQNIDTILAVIIDHEATMFTDTSLPTSTSSEWFRDAEEIQALIQLVHPETGEPTRLFTELGVFFDLFDYNLPLYVGDLMNDVRALPASDVTAEMLRELEKASSLLDGEFTQQRVNQARGAIDAFLKIVHTNRNKLGQENAQHLAGTAEVLINTLPGCAMR